MAVGVRIAPSPTGDGHAGTACVALFDHWFANTRVAKFVPRIAATGRTASPPLFGTMQVPGRELVRKRMATVIEHLKRQNLKRQNLKRQK